MVKLVKFSEIAGIRCYYARKNPAYADLSLCMKSNARKIHPDFLRAMDECLLELKGLTPHFGKLFALTSGGAYVNKPGWHGRGEAYDLGGLFWERTFPENFTSILTVLGCAQEYHEDGVISSMGIIYLGVEAILRRHFGTVLGIHYNPAHWNHWHIDPGTPVAFYTAGNKPSTRVRFLQEVLENVWGIDVGRMDGVCGKKTSRGIAEIIDTLMIDTFVGRHAQRSKAWRNFLLRTAIEAFEVDPILTRR